MEVIIENISRNAQTIYVKGSEKKNWLNRFTKPSTKIIDMFDLKCPSLQDLKNELKNCIQCFHHFKNMPNCNCSLQNVMLLENWLCEQYKEKTNNGYLIF